MKIKISNVLPNPFRRIEHYPIKPEKVAALRASLKKTGFWDNVVARPAANGKVELAYGHHRWRALQDEYGPHHQVELIIRDLSDSEMFHIMADENMEEWGSNAIIEIETVYSLVKAYADGRIEIPKPPKDTNIRNLRHAPSFILGEASEALHSRPYTLQTITNFLDWKEHRVEAALGALEEIESGQASEEDFAGLSMQEIRVSVQEARKRIKDREQQARTDEREAEEARQQGNKKRADWLEKSAQENRVRGKEESQRVLKQVTKKLASGDIGYRQAKEIADSVIPLSKKDPDEINRAVHKLWNQFFHLFRDDVYQEKLTALIEFRNSINPAIRQSLISELNQVAERAQQFAKVIKDTTMTVRQAKSQLALK